MTNTISQSRKIAYYCGVFCIVFAIGWAIYIIGSPSYRKNLLSDHNQIELVRKLELVINEYEKLEKKLPDTIVSLEKKGEKLKEEIPNVNDKNYNFYNLYSSYTSDKKNSNPPYEGYNVLNIQEIHYKKQDDKSYQLCTMFNLDSLEQRRFRYGYEWENSLTEHEKKSGLLEHKKGKHCFQFTIERFN